jgi:hypothetical protein
MTEELEVVQALKIDTLEMALEGIVQQPPSPHTVPPSHDGDIHAHDVDGGGGRVEKRYTDEKHLQCNFGGIGLGTDGEDIQLTTIDHMKVDDIGYIHCDAQGSENFIFAKGLETIKRCRPIIYYENNEFGDRFLYDNVCQTHPLYTAESHFNIKKYCMEQLQYTFCIDRFNGGLDTLLIP